MKYLDATKIQLSNPQKDSSDEFITYDIDADDVKTWGYLQEVDDQFTLYTSKVIYTKEDFNDNDKKVVRAFFDCILSTDNGLTNFIDFDDFEQSNEHYGISAREVADFLRKFPDLAIGVEQGEMPNAIVVQIDVVTQLDRDLIDEIYFNNRFGEPQDRTIKLIDSISGAGYYISTNAPEPVIRKIIVTWKGLSDGPISEIDYLEDELTKLGYTFSDLGETCWDEEVEW